LVPAVGSARVVRPHSQWRAPALRSTWARSRTRAAEAGRERKARVTWWLLFVNVLGPPEAGLFHLPKFAAEVITQGSLVSAVLLALIANPRVRLRPSLYLGIFTLLGLTSLMSSVRLVSVGTAYRGFRLLAFILVLWLLTPWWGRRGAPLLRAQLGFLCGVIGIVVVGALVSPGLAFSGGRLHGVIWPIPGTQVAHYSAEAAGLAGVLWIGKVIRGRQALLIAVPASVVLVLTHTRTALGGAVAGLVVAVLSLLVVRRRARRVFVVSIAVGALVLVPLSPLVVSWLARGESTTQIMDLSGRTKFWDLVFAEQRPMTNEVLGNGLANGQVDGYGYPIDSSWVEDYQDQGIAGDVLTACMFVALLVCAAYRPRGPATAVALFLVVYCLIASFTEDGAGIASQYAMDLTVAASLLVPGAVQSLRPRVGDLGAAV